MTYTPDYVYFVPGLVMLGCGLALLAALVGGPIMIGSVYLGIHFVALGAMLALIGFNVVSLGVLAKSILAQRYDSMRSRTVAWVTQKFSLESGSLRRYADCLRPGN